MSDDLKIAINLMQDKISDYNNIVYLEIPSAVYVIAEKIEE